MMILAGGLWYLAMLLVFEGWGRMLNAALFPGRTAPLGLRIGWGIAVVVALGGLIVLGRATSRPMVLGLAAAGLVAALWPRHRAAEIDRERSESRLIRATYRSFPIRALILSLALGILVLGSTCSRFLHPQDDQQGYLVFPIRLLEEGHLGDDPFNDRNIEAALGGHSFLQTFAAVVFPFQGPEGPRYSRLLDPGFGFIALLASLLAVAGLERCPSWCVLLLLALVVFGPPEPYGNLSSQLLDPALVATVYGTVLWGARPEQGGGSIALGVVLGLLGAAIFSFKTTLVPLALALGAAVYVGRALAGNAPPRRLAGEGLVAIAVMVAALAPWMVAMDRFAGTPLYPILGRGYHGTSYGTFKTPYAGMTPSELARALQRLPSDPHILACLIAAGGAVALSLRRSGGDPWARVRPVVFAALVLAMLTVALATAASNTSHMSGPDDRYNHGTQLILLALALTTVASIPTVSHSEATSIRPRIGPLCVVLIATLLFVGTSAQATRYCYINNLVNLKRAFHPTPYVSAAETSSYRAAQAAVPQGALFVAKVNRPYLFDFRRNRIFSIDWAGGASLPPGMPSFRGPEALADYFQRLEIRYLVFSHFDDGGFDRGFFGPHAEPGRGGPWLETIAKHGLDFLDNVEALRRSRRLLYNDGFLVVIDLARRP